MIYYIKALLGLKQREFGKIKRTSSKSFNFMLNIQFQPYLVENMRYSKGKLGIEV